MGWSNLRLRWGDPAPPISAQPFQAATRLFFFGEVTHPHPSLSLDTPILARGFQRGSLCMKPTVNAQSSVRSGRLQEDHMEANQARVHCSQGSDPDVVWRSSHPGTFYWHQYLPGKNNQKVMPEVLPIEHQLDLSSFWLTGTLTAVTSPDEMSRRYCNMLFCTLRNWARRN